MRYTQVKNMTAEQKMEVYEYRKHLHLTDRGYGGSIMKRVRERFNLSGEDVATICKEIEKELNPNRATL